MFALMLLWLLSQVKLAKDDRFYVVLDGNTKYLPKGTIIHKEASVGKFTIVGTGSRSLVTDQAKFDKVLAYLTELLVKAKAKHGDNLLVISGMAEGFDEALAKAAMVNGIALLAAIPNRGYSNYYWKNHSMTALNRFADFQELANYANTTGGVVYTCGCIKEQPAKCGHWDGRIYNFTRNEWMIKQADIVWVYDPSSRGTAHAYGLARNAGIRTHIVPTAEEG